MTREPKMPVQPLLPFEGTTRCGYCNRRLVSVDDVIGWRCPRCGPLIAALPMTGYADTIRLWRQFARDAHADRVGGG